jgi:hypothetical protein
MAFVQIASYTTTQPEELAAARNRWLEATDGVAAAHRRLLLKDRDVEGRFVELVVYASYEDAMHNAMLPATEALLGHAVHDVGRGVHIANLDVIDGEL